MSLPSAESKKGAPLTGSLFVVCGEPASRANPLRKRLNPSPRKASRSGILAAPLCIFAHRGYSTLSSLRGMNTTFRYLQLRTGRVNSSIAYEPITELRVVASRSRFIVAFFPQFSHGSGLVRLLRFDKSLIKQERRENEQQKAGAFCGRGG